jgi:CheY-like chemotaxis protein
MERQLGSRDVKPIAPASILVLDDDDGFRRFLVRAIEGAGYTVVDTGNGEKAMELLTRQPPFDLLLADVQLPTYQPHGINVGNMALNMRNGPKVIYITGNPDQVPSGFVDTERTPVLAKPIRVETLLAHVKAQIGI